MYTCPHIFTHVNSYTYAYCRSHICVYLPVRVCTSASPHTLHTWLEEGAQMCNFSLCIREDKLARVFLEKRIPTTERTCGGGGELQRNRNKGRRGQSNRGRGIFHAETRYISPVTSAWHRLWTSRASIFTRRRKIRKVVFSRNDRRLGILHTEPRRKSDLRISVISMNRWSDVTNREERRKNGKKTSEKN